MGIFLLQSEGQVPQQFADPRGAMWFPLPRAIEWEELGPFMPETGIEPYVSIGRD